MSKDLAINILDSKGAQKGELKLDSAVFAGDRVSESVVYDTVRYQLLKKRAGTHSTLSKGMMKGGTKKPWKQKGTGRARAGTNTSPIWVGGAVAHGPKPRKYLNRTMKRARNNALAGVFKEKLLSGNVFCFEEIVSARSAEFAALLKALNVHGKKILFIAGSESSNKDGVSAKAVRSARNVKGVRIILAKALNAYDVLNSEAVIVTKSTFEEVSQGLKSRAKLN